MQFVFAGVLFSFAEYFLLLVHKYDVSYAYVGSVGTVTIKIEIFSSSSDLPPIFVTVFIRPSEDFQILLVHFQGSLFKCTLIVLSFQSRVFFLVCHSFSLHMTARHGNSFLRIR